MPPLQRVACETRRRREGAYCSAGEADVVLGSFKAWLLMRTRDVTLAKRRTVAWSAKDSGRVDAKKNDSLIIR